MAKIIAVTGGIGSGKSIVSKILIAEGFPVYDCDSAAKDLMDNNHQIQNNLCAEIHPDAVKCGVIDRHLISSIVFADDDKLAKLNRIVHSGVRKDLANWLSANVGHKYVFVETAILYQSQLDRMVDEVWEVVAPRELRIERVMSRNQMRRADVENRISVQDSYVPDRKVGNTYMIINDGVMAVLPQIKKLL